VPAVCWRFALEPAPIEKPTAMKISSAVTFKVARALLTNRPGPTPRMCIAANSQTAAIATIVWRENDSGTNGIGTTKKGVASATPGTNRLRYSTKTTALAAIAPAKPATKDVHPVRNAASRPYAAPR
jgi:hypothetical protein